MIKTRLGMHVKDVVALTETEALVEAFRHGWQQWIARDQLVCERPGELEENHSRYVESMAAAEQIDPRDWRILEAAGL